MTSTFMRGGRLVTAGLVLAALVAAGCSSTTKGRDVTPPPGGDASSGPPSAPADSMSAEEVTSRSDEAMNALHAVHVTGTGRSEGNESQPVEVDLHFGAGGSSGHMTMAGQRVDIAAVPGTVYLEAPAAFWRQLFDRNGEAAAPVGKLAGRWVEVSVRDGQFPDIEYITLAQAGLADLTSIGDFFDEITATYDTSLATEAGTKEVDGITATGYNEPDHGQTIYVATDGTFRTVEIDGGPGHDHLTFSEFDEPFTPQAPPAASTVAFDSVL